MNTATSIPVSEASQVAEARRVTAAIARKAGFDETEAGKVAITATEIATNLLKHAGGGELVIHELVEPTAHGLELYALDKGCGMANLDICLEDGYSTAGSPGTGLGAIQRQSQTMDVYSQPGKGTALVARCWRKDSKPEDSVLDVAGFSVPLRGETACGDAWTVHHHSHGCVLLIVDGLGHGELAAAAAREAVATFHSHTHLAPLQLLQQIHAGLRGTRGAAGAVLSLDVNTGVLEFAGVGNIAAGIVEAERTRHAVSVGGILGQDVHNWRQFSYPWFPGDPLVAHSDGIGTRWDLGLHPGLRLQSPALIAAVLYRDFVRGRDDATVVVARARRSTE